MIREMANERDVDDKINLKLYSFPTSPYCQKVCIALEEKGLPFTIEEVNLRKCETLSHWFMRLHPEGTIPVLVDGDVVVPDSMRILDYIEEKFTSGVRLLPPPKSPQNMTCVRLSKMIHDLNISLLTYKTLEKDEITEGCQIPSVFRKNVRKGLTGALETLSKRLQEAPADLKESYVKKRYYWLSREAMTLDENLFQHVLDEVEMIMVEGERALGEARKNTSGSIYWVCGDDLTLADIHLGTLLVRLNHLGLSRRFFLKENLNRTELTSYFQRILERPSFKKYIPSYSIFNLLIKPILISASPYLVFLLIFVYFIYKFTN